MGTFATTTSTAFTYTHARRIASKVAADLMRYHRFYGSPSQSRIDQFEEELVELLRYNAIDEVTYGFRKGNQWITAVKYKAVDGELLADDVPGALRVVDLEGASFGSFLSYSMAWYLMSAENQKKIKAALPFERSYSAGGRGLRRSKIQRY